MVKATRRTRRGETLTELVVVMAVIAIFSISTLTFTIATRSQVRFNESVSQATSELVLCKNTAALWLSYFDAPDYAITIEGDGRILTAAEQGGEDPQTFSLSFDSAEKKLTAEYPNAAPQAIALDEIEDMTFAAPTGDAPRLYAATVTYEIDGGDRTGSREAVFYFAARNEGSAS